MGEVRNLDEFRRQKELNESVPRLASSTHESTDPKELQLTESINADPRLYGRLLGVESSHISGFGDLTTEEERNLESKLIQIECRLPLSVLTDLQDKVASTSSGGK